MRGWKPIFASVAAGFALFGCETPPPLYDRGQADTIQNAANLYISAYPPIPWSDIADKLNPNNNLTIAEARTLAAQTTQAQVNQFLSTFAAGLSVNLPLSTKLITTTIGADGTAETTGTRTRGTGSVPSGSGVPSATIADDALAANLAKGLANVPIDGSTLLTVGTALYQQAQILDHQISKGLLPEGYEAYLVTFQVNLQPRRRNLSYDAYINVNLMPGTWQEALDTSKAVESETSGLPPIMVYPLVITDAMETASVNRSIEAVRQAALQLSGVLGTFGIGAGLAGGSDRLESVVGLDKNSIVTVGRVSDHTLRIRLGAQQSGSSGMAMVPRSYNVSTVVLSRTGKDRVKNLSVITEMSLISTETGEELGGGVSRRRDELSKRVLHLLDQYGFTLTDRCPVAKYKEPEPSMMRRVLWALDPDQERQGKKKMEEESDQKERALQLLRAVDRSDYNTVNTCLGLNASEMRKNSNPNSDLKIQNELTLRRLISDLIEVQIDSRFSKLLIALKKPLEPELPQNTMALMSDDGKSKSVVSVYGGKDLTAKAMKAELVYGSNLKLVPSSIVVQGTPLETRITFPSVAQLKKIPDFSATPQLLLETDGKQRTYGLAALPDSTEPAKNPVEASQTVLIADAGGRAQATLMVGKFPSGVSSLYLRIAGADVREDKGMGAAAPSAKGVQVKAEAPVTIALGNLTPARTVTVATVDDKGQRLGEPLVFTVDRVAAAK